MSDAPDSPGPATHDTDAHLDALVGRCTFAPPGTPSICALSGGADSTALVALAVAADLEVSVIHVDHGLRPDSAHDAELAAATAAHFGVAFRAVTRSVPPGANLEARARTVRRSIIGPDALTGHTADDQAETLLLNLLRGAGATGLAAMRPSHAKPMLAIRRSETRALCLQLGLDVAVDPTNSDPRFRRNRIRHDVLPLLDEIGERDTTPLFARTSALLRDDDDYLTELAAQIDPTDARTLARAELPIARRAVRRWLTTTLSSESESGSESETQFRSGSAGGDVHPPDTAAVERVLAVARGDAGACDVVGGWRVERSQQRLRLFFAGRSTR